jgi:hypothetical protein
LNPSALTGALFQGNRNCQIAGAELNAVQAVPFLPKLFMSFNRKKLFWAPTKVRIGNVPQYNSNVVVGIVSTFYARQSGIRV